MLSPDIFAALEYYGGHTSLIVSVLLKPDKFHIFAAVGGIQGQKLLMLYLFHGHQRITGFSRHLFWFLKCLNIYAKIWYRWNIHCSSLGISTMVAFIISSQGQVQQRNICILDYTPMHKYVCPGCPRINNVRLRKAELQPHGLKMLFLWCTSRAFSPRTVTQHSNNFFFHNLFVHTTQVRPVLTLQFSNI